MRTSRGRETVCRAIPSSRIIILKVCSSQEDRTSHLRYSYVPSPAAGVFARRARCPARGEGAVIADCFRSDAKIERRLVASLVEKPPPFMRRSRRELQFPSPSKSAHKLEQRSNRKHQQPTSKQASKQPSNHEAPTFHLDPFDGFGCGRGKPSWRWGARVGSGSWYFGNWEVYGLGVGLSHSYAGANSPCPGNPSIWGNDAWFTTRNYSRYRRFPPDIGFPSCCPGADSTLGAKLSVTQPPVRDWFDLHEHEEQLHHEGNARAGCIDSRFAHPRHS